MEAIQVEFDSLENNLQVWEFIKHQPWMSVLLATLTLKLNQFIKRFKVWFCAHGDKQKEGVDFFETWSPVVQWSMICLLMVFSTKLGLHSAHVDITGAFVHASLAPDENIYILQPPGFVYSAPSQYVLKLKCSLYGLCQAP